MYAVLVGVRHFPWSTPRPLVPSIFLQLCTRCWGLSLIRFRLTQVLGADREGVVFHKKYDRIPVTLRESFGLEKDVARHLSRNYGTRALQVAQIAGRDPKLARRLCSRYPVLAAEVIFAVEQVRRRMYGVGGLWLTKFSVSNDQQRPLPSNLMCACLRVIQSYYPRLFCLQEYAQTVVDVLARRTRLAYLDAKAAADAVPATVELMAGPLG